MFPKQSTAHNALLKIAKILARDTTPTLLSLINTQHPPLNNIAPSSEGAAHQPQQDIPTL